MTQQMQAIEIQPPGRLSLTKRPAPTPGPGEVLIRVHAAGVNRPDLLQRQGKYPPPPGITDIPGLEIAGEIVGTGEKVCALLAGGGYAEYAVVPAGQCLPLPANLTMAEGACLPETVFTVWNNVFLRGGLRPGETLLVHGGSSGIGTTAIQMARAFGATVVITAGSDEKCASCIDLGANRAINYKTQDFVKEAGPVDVVLDMVGGDYVPRNLECLTDGGRHVSIAFQSGPRTEIDIRTIMQKRIIMTGSTLRPRPAAEKARLAKDILKTVWPWIESGRVRPVLHKTFPLAEAQAAHDLLESGQIAGKLALICV